MCIQIMRPMQTNRGKQNKAPLAYLAHASAGDPARVPADAEAVAASAPRNVPACPQGRRSIVRRPLRVQAQPRAVYGGSRPRGRSARRFKRARNGIGAARSLCVVGAVRSRATVIVEQSYQVKRTGFLFIMSKTEVSLVYESVNRDWDAVASRDFCFRDGGVLQLLGIASPGLGSPYFQASYQKDFSVRGAWFPSTVTLGGKVDCYNRISSRVAVKRDWVLDSGETFRLHGILATSHSKLRYRYAVVRAGLIKTFRLKGQPEEFAPIKLGVACDTAGKCIGVAKQGRVQLSTDWKGNWTAKIALKEVEKNEEDWI
jgi:hypothetical protein